MVCSWAGEVVSFSSMFRPLTNPHPRHLPGCCSGTNSALILPILLYHCAGHSHPAHFSPRLQVLPLTTGHLALSSSCACTFLSNPCLVLAHLDPWPSLLSGLPISDCWHFILCTIHHLLAQSTGLKAKVSLQPGHYLALSLLARPNYPGLFTTSWPFLKQDPLP